MVFYADLSFFSILFYQPITSNEFVYVCVCVCVCVCQCACVRACVRACRVCYAKRVSVDLCKHPGPSCDGGGD